MQVFLSCRFCFHVLLIDRYTCQHLIFLEKCCRLLQLPFQMQAVCLSLVVCIPSIRHGQPLHGILMHHPVLLCGRDCNWHSWHEPSRLAVCRVTFLSDYCSNAASFSCASKPCCADDDADDDGGEASAAPKPPAAPAADTQAKSSRRGNKKGGAANQFALVMMMTMMLWTLWHMPLQQQAVTARGKEPLVGRTRQGQGWCQGRGEKAPASAFDLLNGRRYASMMETKEEDGEDEGPVEPAGRGSGQRQSGQGAKGGGAAASSAFDLLEAEAGGGRGR